jgi:hypothetical protein
MVTHAELTQSAGNWLKKHTNNVVIPNCPLVITELHAMGTNGEIPDVLGFNYCNSVMIEVKVSRSDFLIDKKKPHRKYGTGQFKYYCCPKDLISEDEIPSGWGLLYAVRDKGRIKISTIKLATQTPTNLEAERSILLSIIRRKNDSVKEFIKQHNI